MWTRHRTGSFWICGVSALLATAGCGGGTENAEMPPEPTALVSVVPAESGILTQTLVAYGTVVAAPGARQTPSVPFEATVSRVLVTEGMPVTKGQSLVALRPSPTAQIEIEAAHSALQAAEDQFHTAEERDSLGLATRDQMSRVKQELSDARTRYAELSQWEKTRDVVAAAAGVVTDVPAAEGALVPAGAPLVSLALEGRFEVRLGVEPENIHLVHAGQSVTITRLAQPDHAAANGRVRSVARSVNPVTRLVDVMVTTTADEPLIYAETVRGTISIRDDNGVIVPRSAVLPQEGKYRAFTVVGGRAFGHAVTVGIETDSLVEVTSGLSPGDSVVVLGNYVLEDSMRVRRTSSPATTTVPE